MAGLRLRDIIAGTAPRAVHGDAPGEAPISGVSHDSRLVEPGMLFVALRGERDGHEFVPDAVARGARAVLVERPLPENLWREAAPDRPVAQLVVDDSLRALQRLAGHWRRRMPVQVVGVTGSVGKTSTKEAIAGLLGKRYRVLKNEKNYNNEIGLPLTLLSLDEGHERAVLEMGMYSLGEIRDLCSLALPAIGVVTNVGPVHLERLGTIERIAEAKSELVQALPADGLAVLNGDDERVQAMAAVTPARVLYYGLGESCDVRAEDISLQGIEGSSFTLIAHGHSARVRLGLPGRHSVYNALAAAAVAFASGLSWDEVTASLAELRPGLRLVFVPGVNGSVIIDDTYNASPASTCAALDVLAQVPGRRAAILGDMLELGSQEEEGHREVGRRAAEVVHSLVVVGRRARWIAAEAQARGLREIAYFDTSREVEYHPRPGEHVLVKGSRSMSMEVVVEKLRAAEVGA